MSTAIPPMNEMVQMLKHHRDVKMKWEVEKGQLQNELSALTGWKAAIDLCRREMEEQIYNLQLSLGLIEDGQNSSQEAGEKNLRLSRTIALSSPLVQSVHEIEAQEEKEADFSGEFTRPEHKAEFSYKLKTQISVHLDSIRAVAFYPNSPILVTASDDGTMKVVNLEPKPAPAKKGSKKKIRKPYQSITSLRGHRTPVLSLTTLSSGGDQYMISGALDGTIVVWQLPKPELTLATVYGVVNHNQQFYYKNIHKDAVWSIETFGTTAISASADGTLKQWDIFLGTPTDISTPDKPLLCKVCNNTHFIVACSNRNLVFYSNLIPTKTITLEGNSEITALSVVHSDRFALIGFEDGNITIVSYPLLEVVKTIQTGPTQVASLSPTPCNDFIIACLSDGKVKAYSMGDFEEKSFGGEGKEVHLTKYGEGALCVAPSGHCAKSYFATTGADGIIHVFIHESKT